MPRNTQFFRRHQCARLVGMALWLAGSGAPRSSNDGIDVRRFAVRRRNCSDRLWLVVAPVYGCLCTVRRFGGPGFQRSGPVPVDGKTLRILVVLVTGERDCGAALYFPRAERHSGALCGLPRERDCRPQALANLS